MSVIILGSGGSPGVPMPGCDCAVCASIDPCDQRTRCSALVSWRGKSILIDASTDLRQQALRENIRRIDAVLFTHTHADHLHGIDDLRPFNRHHDGPIPVYASAMAENHLRRVFPYIFCAGDGEGYRPELSLNTFDGPFEVCGLPITPVLLQHGRGEAYGFRFGPFAYLTDCSGLPDSSRELLRGISTLVIDGLRWRPHTTHFNIPEAVACANSLGIKRVILTHLNHEVAHRRDSQRLPEGVEFAYDGQVIEVK
ncbi:MAG: MBL fold metallo-hydrolase [Desulfuromonas sp.]|nr:MAG: MBL fold metallo-hydrolase [Desulfuromonas sp.]